jgi:3-phosphoshikimate 1-carboxyvinyltransferase
MPLPPLIEILPPAVPPQATITVPGSKSITNRALVLAALSHGETTLHGALWSEDTQVMVECLRELGFTVTVEPDRREPGNRTLTVYGLGGQVPRGGTEQQPLELYVANAGTAARFLAALVCLGRGVYRLHGTKRMHERPEAALWEALRSLGYRVDAAGDRLPAVIHGGGPRPGTCRVSIAASSQFASALLLGAGVGQWRVCVEGENAEESPYVHMTTSLVAAFPREGGLVEIEPDASSGSYFWAAGYLLAPPETRTQLSTAAPTTCRVEVARWPQSGWQVDERFRAWLTALGTPAPVNAAGSPIAAGPRPQLLSRRHDLGDSILTAMVVAPFLDEPTVFTDLGRLRFQECERVRAMRTELTRCGARVAESGDTLRVFPARDQLRGAEVETYQDHRLAMCFAILGLKVAGVKIKNPACVKKTFPNFFQKLAGPPPSGLGIGILDAASGRPLEVPALFAD